jgi:hypothetical protein
MATDPLVPTKTPFNFNLGINYATQEYGRTGRSITADLDQITQYFGLIRTYQDVQDPTSSSNPTINLNEQQVINYIVDPSHAPNLQVAMGTWTSAVTSGGFGQAWAAGFMTSQTYTDAWVQMIITSFGSVQAVKDHLPMILLGNEIDQTYNFDSTNSTTTQTYIGWVEQSFNNLKTSLANAGLGSIPISTTIAAYNRSDLGDMVSKQVTAYIFQNWSASWNGGQPAVLFNSYTGDDGHGFSSSTDFSTVIAYYNSLQQTFSSTGPNVAPFSGETGYSSYYNQFTPNAQATVYNQISAWLNGQYANNGHRTIPLFPFDAFDLPQPPGGQPVETGFGIFSQNGSFQPTGLKSELTLPVWSRNQILAHQALMSSRTNDGLLMQNGQQLAYWAVNGNQITGSGNLGQPLGSGWSVLGAGAFEGSGSNASLLLANGQQLAEWKVSGGSVIGGGNVSSQLLAGWSVAAIGDLFGDTHSALVLQNGQQLAVWQMNGQAVVGGGNIGTLGTGWSIAGVGDFNKDGREDLLLQNGQQLAEWLMNGQSVIGGGTIDSLGAGWSVAGVGDFNKDGFSDLLLQNGQLLASWQMNGTSVIGGGNIGTLAAGWSATGVGNYNHTGFGDSLLLQNGQQLAQWQLNGTSVVGSGNLGPSLGTPWTFATGTHLG